MLHFKNWEIPIYYTPSFTFLNFCSDVIELNKYNKIKKTNKQTTKICELMKQTL